MSQNEPFSLKSLSNIFVVGGVLAVALALFVWLLLGVFVL